METVSVNSSDEKVYRFDESKYPKVYLPKLALAAGFYIVYFSIYILLNFYLFSDRNITFMLISSLIAIIALVVHFFKNRSLVRGSFVKINSEGMALAIFRTYRVSNEVSYAVNRIDKVRKTRFSLIVYGDIEATTMYYHDKGAPVIGEKRRLRIPAYFENMDEIYNVLEKMKGQTGD